MTHILAISGSLRQASSNTRLLKAIAQLAPETMTVSLYADIGQLPHFNPELDTEEPLETVREWRSHLAAADAILFCTPEYAHGIPGVLKNALDWIVSSGEFVHKPTAVISASPGPDGGNKANAALVQTLTVMMAAIPEQAVLCIPAISAQLNERNEIVDDATQQAILKLLKALINEQGE